MKRISPPTREDVLAIYDYDRGTGNFRHKISRGNRRAGSIAGSHNTKANGRPGRITIEVNGISYQAHHIAWLLEYGEWPQRLDHKNVDPSVNKIKNLRKATASQNGANHFGWSKRKLPKGVSLSGRKRNKFCAQIKSKQKNNIPRKV